MSLQKLKDAFSEALRLAPDCDVEILEYRGIATWDSVGHMQLIAEIEAAFDIMLETEDVLAMSSFTKGKEIVTKYGVDLDAPG